MMKKLFLILFFAIAGFVAQAGNTVTVSQTEGHPDDVATVAVNVQNTDIITGMQITIPLDKFLSYEAGSASLTERADGLQVSANASDGELHIVVYGFGKDRQIGAGDGTVVTFKLKLNWAPNVYPLTPKVLLSDADGNPLDCTTTDGSVTILTPQIATAEKVVDWGRVAITRGPYTRSVTIQNTGTEPLHISNITFDNEDFSVAEPQLTITAGDSKSLPIAYAPVQYAWSLTAHMTIESDAINGKKEVTLTAIPYSVNELHLGEASGICDEIVEVPITVNNMEPLVGVQFDIALPDELKYVEGSFATAERTSGLTATSAIDGNKLTLMLYSLTNATMEGNDGVIGTFKLRLDGRSNWYWLNPENVRLSNIKLENMTSATSGGYVKIQSPVYGGSTSLDMGKTSVTETAQATYSMRNDGNVPLTIEKVAFLADGFAVVEQLPMVIPANEAAALTVQFSPTVEGAYSTFMNVYTNDPDHRMVQVKVNGEIFEPNRLTLDGERDTNQKGYTLKVGMDNYTTDLVGMQFDVHWTNAMHYESVKASDRWNNEHITAIPINDNTLRVVAYTIPSTAILGNSGELMRLHFTCNDEAYEGTTVRIDSISLSNTKGEQKSSIQDLAMKIVKMGDVNDDGVIDVTDVTMLINRVLGTKSTNFHESVADMNGDTVLDVTDVTLLINKVLKGE
mgnify:FL=1